jgi:hypothetical protein
MKRVLIFLFAIQGLCCLSAQAQEPIEYFITGNVNLYVPFNSSKGMYPILGYDKDVSPKVLLGGFGVGFSGLKKLGSQIAIKGQANISRSVYWESALLNIGPGQSQVIGIIPLSSTDYNFGLTGTIHYHLSPIFSAGTGLGAQVLIGSYMHIRAKSSIQNWDRYVGRNQYYKRVMPTLPVEVSARFRKMFITLRYEHGLLNRLKKNLAEYKTDRYGLVFVEVGFKVR